MRLSNKSTFSLVCFILIFALAFAALPAMAQVTIEATWSADRDDNGTADDPGWRVTVGGIATGDTVTVTAVEPSGGVVADADISTFAEDAGPPITSQGNIAAVVGRVIAVRVAKATAGVTTTYQRVRFPAGGTGATLASTTLTLIPKLRKLDTPNYYVDFTNNIATIMFDFEAAMADSHGAPSAPLHISDVNLVAPNSASLQVVSVSGTNMVMVRSTLGSAIASENTIVNLVAAYALAADPDDPVNVPGNGTARVYYDDTAPAATIGTVRPVATPSDFAAPEVDENTIWDEAFYLSVTVIDDPATDGTNNTAVDGSGPALTMANVMVDDTLTVVRVGVNATQSATAVDTADTDMDETDYLIQIMPNDTPRAQGAEATITITPVDRSGNAGTPVRHMVKLAAVVAPTVNNAPDFGANTISNIMATAGTAITDVTLPAATDADSGDTLTYTITPDLPAGIMFNATTRVLSGTPTAMMAQTTYTYMVSDGTDSDTIMFMITVAAAPLDEVATDTSSGVITIQPESHVVVVRNMSDTTTKGIQFRRDVTVVEWAGMPNLERLFYTGNQGVILGKGGGGALILTESAAQTKDRRHGSVGISEIMWGIDAGHLGDEDMEQAGQWIELHNLNKMVEAVADDPATDADETVEGDDGVAKVVLSWKTGRDITSDSALTGNLSNPTLDVVTNFFNNRPGGQAWQVKGNSGNSVAGVDFASMGRILPDKKAKYENADGSRYDNRDGRNAGHWSASTSAYLTARTTRTDETDVVFQYLGTPGRVNNAVVDVQPHIRAARTSVASDNIYINEVGNLTGSSHDWIELRNNSGGNINLRNYLISIVAGNADDSDKAMIQFDNNNNAQVAAGEVFLLLRTDPADDPNHPIAATGYNVDKTAEEQQPGTPNSTVRYKVFGGLDLPDDGNFILIVRRPDNHEGHRSGAHNDHGVAETGNADLDKVVDVAGWSDKVGRNGYPNAVSNTGVFPLHGFGNPFTDRNSFKVNTVHRRQYLTTNDGRSGVGAHENKNQDDRAAFRDVGWTGVGYRRGVATTNMHGGTPGYNNGALHGAGATITTAVYISEIMYADARNGSLPQWIELRNSSNSEGADLHNWRLTIINHADKDEFEDGGWAGKGVASVLLRNLKIKPNGTVLITSRKGPRQEVHLPTSDIFSLFPTHRGTFGMTNANSDVINPFGFRIILQANAHDTNKMNEWQLVEDIGNLAAPNPRDRRGDNEQFDMPMWMWPDAVGEDGSRSSVARTNNKVHGIGDGKMMSSWILSSEDPRTNLIDYVYYGHTDDIATPGQTVGQPLPVELSHFRPELENGEVVIRWTTESELDNAGFNILRSDTRNGEFKQVNAEMIQGNGTTGERNTYKWVDATAKPGVVYYYQIEDVSFAGERQTLQTTKLKGYISAVGKATTTWGDIKEVQ
ncbi:hypothetical protein C6497_16015 [Candidatus Poribacteria bacterium]|nr:MAG: hypothetical protein C6497_16015 [Candidatus Poribacteria bacterium]